MQADHYLGGVSFDGDIAEGGGNVGVEAFESLHLDTEVFSHRLSTPHSSGRHGTRSRVIATTNMEQGNRIMIQATAHRDGKSHKPLGSEGIGDGDYLPCKTGFADIFLLEVECFESHAYIAGGTLGGDRCHHAADQDHDNRPISDIFGEHIILKTDHDGGDGGGSLSGGESEHEASLIGGEAIDQARGMSGYPLGYQGDRRHIDHHPEDIPAGENGADIDQHTYPDEEIWYEDRIADEADVAHQRTTTGDKAVEHQPGIECAEDRLQTDDLGE